MMALAAALAAALRLAMAFVFAQSTWHAGRDWPRHVAAIAAYRLLPPRAAPAAAFLLTAANALVALLLLYAPMAAIAACAGAALLLLYAGAMAINVRRGRVHIDCGCGATGERISVLLVLRNVILGCLLGAAAFASAVGYDTITISAIGGSALSLAALHFATNQLLANRAASTAQGVHA